MYMKQYGFCLVLIVFLGFTGFSQTPDVFRLEYMMMPENDSEVELSRIKLVANVPIKVKDSNTMYELMQ